MSERASFVLYTKTKKIIDQLTNEQAGILFKRIFAYCSGEELEDVDALTNMAFTIIQEYLDADYQKYLDKVSRNRANGLLGGRPKKKQEGKSETRQTEPRADIPYQEIISNYNRIISMKECPKISLAEDSLSDQRKKLISGRLKDNTVEDLYKVFEKARDSDWLSGRTGRKGANFGLTWMVRPENFTKIKEGYYDNDAGGDSEYGDYVEGLFADEYI